MSNLEYCKSAIVEHFNNTSISNLDNGFTWYEDAHVYAIDLAMEFNIELSKVIGIMAALSPNNKWERNKIDTRKFLEYPSILTKVCTFKGQRIKALKIYHGSGLHEDIEKVLNGIKTKNFYHNIMFYHKSTRVTIDMWAFRSVNMLPKLKNVKLITQAYEDVANEFNILPHQLQAVVWGVVRGNLV